MQSTREHAQQTQQTYKDMHSTSNTSSNCVRSFVFITLDLLPF